MKIRDKDSRIVKNKAVYLALGITAEGQREVLGLWIADSGRDQDLIQWIKSPRPRREVLAGDHERAPEPRRGRHPDSGGGWAEGGFARSCLKPSPGRFAACGGPARTPEAITAAFPQTTVQTCVVHLVRHSLAFCSWKDRKSVAASLKAVYGAPDADAAREALEEFDAQWGDQYPSIAQAWRRAWEEVIPFFAFSPEIRRVIYTTNAVESLNRVIRKAIKTRGSFPSEQLAEKLIYLTIRANQNTSRTVRGWLTAVNQFAIPFEDRFSPVRG